MRIEVDEERNILLSDVFNGIGIKTDIGIFGICQSDGGIELTLDGKIVYVHYPYGRDMIFPPRNVDSTTQTEGSDDG